MNSSQGGGSKDTWVLAGERRAAVARRERGPRTAHPLPAPDEFHDVEIRQQQQQQQQQTGDEPC